MPIVSEQDYLEHYGIKGMKWGVRRTPEQLGHRSTSLRAAIARRQNAKVDKSFKKWEAESKKKNDAISLGKAANAAKMAYEKDKSNKDLKKAYKSADKEYQKALKANTTYRKGSIRQEVGKDMSRKYLSEAKKVKKELAKDPSNSQLQKKYDQLMSKHDIERASARKAQDVGAARSRKIASMKRAATMTVKTAVATAALGAGVAAANRYLSSGNAKVNLNAAEVADWIKKGRQFMRYVY